MLGLFRQKATPYDFGQGIMHLVKDPLSDEGARSLGLRFMDFDASNGWIPFLESKGVSIDNQLLYIRLYQHCALQAACTRFHTVTSHLILTGAIEGFTKQPEGYQFETVYETLKSAYAGRRICHDVIESFSNSEASIPSLPNPNVGVINTRFLIDRFIKSRMPNAPAYLDDFKSYSQSVTVGVATAQNAVNYLLKKVKIVG